MKLICNKKTKKNDKGEIMDTYFYNIQEVINTVNENTLAYVIIVIITAGIAYVQYAFINKVARQTSRSPWKLWVHAYFFGHDTCFVFLFYYYWQTLQSPIWMMMSFMCFIFNFFEIYALYITVKQERQYMWGKLYKNPVTLKQGLIRGIAMYAMSVVLFNVLRMSLQDNLMLWVMISTNVVVFLATPFAIEEHLKDHLKTKVYYSKKDYIIVSLACLGANIVSFLPPGYGMWTTAAPDYFNQFWFYLCGALCLVVQIWGLYVVLKHPSYEELNSTVNQNTVQLNN